MIAVGRRPPIDLRNASESPVLGMNRVVKYFFKRCFVSPVHPAQRAVGILSWIIFGLIAGAVAKLLLPGSDPGGCLLTVLIGIAGAVVGGFVGTQLGYGTVTGFDLRSFMIAILGSLILLVFYRAIAGE
jgi:uncharacterized membrane protein YeaQ/YmgE (transglycosylase-associated protein family)